MIGIIDTKVFNTHPDAQQFIDKQLRRGRGCTLVVGNAGYVVDVYVKRYGEFA
ncbi:MAG: hypothetical protein KTR20_14185 [Cellvibrionaceae bacterium]|nr:hypothetical protein [Cellvibrionaceae bacterium]